MVFNATFNNISAISWQSVFLVDETGFKLLLNVCSISFCNKYVDLQLPVQSVPITTKVVSLNPVLGDVYSIQHYVIYL
jgi:hypothetical protein